MIRPIAIYLPQYHPIPENDEWWGKGFTEWTNVTKAKPLFKGHYQPHLPADLGFYDLRLAEARQAQADLAKEYGIYGFCYYHYWFNGRRIIERPFQEVFESGSPDLPFMLCWANENWTRIWDGGEKNILLEQHYNHTDDLNHIKSLIPYFKDSRYIKIDGKPVFSVYRSDLLPDMKKTIQIWRDEAAKYGIELYLCRFEGGKMQGNEYLKDGFDAAIEFPPHNSSSQGFLKERSISALLNSIKVHSFSFLQRHLLPSLSFGLIEPYKKIVQRQIEGLKNKKDYKIFPGVCPSFDNTSRKKKNYVIYKDSTPELFETWLNEKVNNFKPFSKDENLFLINAWNEWAEGNHLEPCQKWGLKYLEVVKKIFAAKNNQL